MENFMDNLDITAVTRMALIYVHLLGFAGAAAFVAQGDYALLGQSRIDMALLRRSARFVSVALAVLWISGLAVIWMDTHFVLSVLQTKPKLLAKLSIVTILTINGVALHTLAFPAWRTRTLTRSVRCCCLASWGASVPPPGCMPPLWAWARP